MEMLKPHRRYMRRTFQTGLWLQYRTSAHQVQLHAKINRLQINNQLSECVFPVILAPVPPPKSVTQSTGIDSRSLFTNRHVHFLQILALNERNPSYLSPTELRVFRKYFLPHSHEAFRGAQHGQTPVGAQHRATVPIL